MACFVIGVSRHLRSRPPGSIPWHRWQFARLPNPHFGPPFAVDRSRVDETVILQHVLPKGFRRVRNYGFLHPNRKSLIALLHIVLKIARRPSLPDEPRPAPRRRSP